MRNSFWKKLKIFFQCDILDIKSGRKRGDAVAKKILKRDLELEALNRIEEAARSEKDFKEVVTWWNRLDANRRRKERDHEYRYDENSFNQEEHNPEIDWRKVCNDMDFIDLFSMCPCKMHDMLTDPDIAVLLAKATDKQKAVFFPRFVVGCSTERIAHCHEMTDRNVRKLIALMLENLREPFAELLAKRQELGEPLTYEEREFLKDYKSPIKTEKKKKAKK